MNELRKIWHFDDGLQRYFNLDPNKWLVIGKKYKGGKLVLQNVEYKNIIINSISEWKTRVIKNQGH